MRGEVETTYTFVPDWPGVCFDGAKQGVPLHIHIPNLHFLLALEEKRDMVTAGKRENSNR